MWRTAIRSITNSSAKRAPSVGTMVPAKLLRSRLAFSLQPLVEIGADRSKQRFHLAVKEMIGALHNLLFDYDAFLGLELVDQRCDVLVRHHGIFVAMDDQARRRAGCQEREIIKVCRRADRDETLDLRPTHQQLHPNPRTERESGDPAALCLGINGLRPIERGGRVGQFPLPVVKRTLTPAYATEIEAQCRKSP